MAQLRLEGRADIAPAPYALELPRKEEEEEEAAACVLDTVGASSGAEGQPELSSDHPFHDVARHGILQVAGQDRCGRRVVTFSCCRLPPSHQLDHRRLLEYRKSLKALYIVHPGGSFRILWAVFKPLISHKFGKKITYVDSLRELQDYLPELQLPVPAEVRRYDEARQSLLRGPPPPPTKMPPPRPPLPTQQFGVSLQYLRDKNQGALIPPVLRFTVTYLREKGLRTEGLFRKSASIQSVREVQRLYNQGKPVDFDAYGDVHVAAATLKTFLRELPQPLLTAEAFEQILGITGVESSLRVTRCRQILQSLPDLNYAVLSYLLGFLHSVSRESLFNRMTSSSLARVFGLNLLWPSQGAASLSALVPLLLFTELLIEYYGTVFRAPQEGGEDSGAPDSGGPTSLPAPAMPPPRPPPPVARTLQ